MKQIMPTFKKVPSVFLLLLCGFMPIFGQSVLKIGHSCNFNGEDSETDFYVDEPSKEATKIVGEVMRNYVLTQNFIIKSSDCKNALATVDGDKRYILYSTSFLAKFKQDAQTKWAAYCVLAHEIGHHLNNHNLAETNNGKRKINELQADKFAGGVLFNMGATLEQAQAGINTFSLEGEGTSHPRKNSRLEAIAQGWQQAQDLRGEPTSEPQPQGEKNAEPTPKSKSKMPKNNYPNNAQNTSQKVKPTTKPQNNTTENNNVIQPVQQPETGFRVIEINVHADPVNSTGPCPKKITFTARISVVGGAGTVSYKWVGSDGGSGPVETLRFDEPGSKTVETFWVLNGRNYENFWNQIEVFDPKPMKSNQAFFTLKCQ